MVKLVKSVGNKFRGFILILVVKIDENLNFFKEPPKCGAKCEKGVKVWCSYYIKMRVKSVVRGKLLNKKCGTFEKCGTK